MPDQIVSFQGGVLAGDTANTAGAYVKRDASGNTSVSGGNFSTFVNTAGELFVKHITVSGTATLSHTPGGSPLPTTVVYLDASGGAFNCTLPAAAGSVGQVYVFVKIDSGGNVPTVKASGSETINGANTYTGLSAQYKTVIIHCDGTQWTILAKI